MVLFELELGDGAVSVVIVSADSFQSIYSCDKRTVTVCCFRASRLKMRVRDILAISIQVHEILLGCLRNLVAHVGPPFDLPEAVTYVSHPV